MVCEGIKRRVLEEVARRVEVQESIGEIRNNAPRAWSTRPIGPRVV